MSNELDGGEIIHQCVGTLERGDGMHDVSCKSLLQVSDDVCSILTSMESGRKIISTRQAEYGRMYKNKDFRPEHLRVIYKLYGNKIVDAYLDGQLNCDNPKLICGL